MFALAYFSAFVNDGDSHRGPGFRAGYQAALDDLGARLRLDMERYRRLVSDMHRSQKTMSHAGD